MLAAAEKFRAAKNTITMQIVSTATAFPKHYYPQEMLLAALQEFWGERIDNPSVLRRLHRHVGVDGRYLSIPKEEYLTMKTWGEANRHWIRTATELGEKAVGGALAGAGLDRPQPGRVLLHVGDRHMQPFDRRAADQQDGAVPQHSARAHLWSGLRGGRCWNFARCRLREGLSRSGRGRAVGGTLLAHLAARRHLDGESDFFGTVRRRCCRRDCCGRRVRVSPGPPFLLRVRFFIPTPKR